MSSKELWPFIFIIGLILFNWPFLDIFRMSLPHYLFGAWGLLIACVGILIAILNKKGEDGDV